MNQIYLVGRINRKITFTNYANGRQEAKSEIAVNRLDNSEIDYIPFKVTKYGVYEQLKDYKKDDFVGIKGSLRFEKNKLFVDVHSIIKGGISDINED